MTNTLSDSQKQQRQAWLDGLKPGDEIAFQQGGPGQAYEIVTVVSRTPTGRINAGRYTFTPQGDYFGKWTVYTPSRCLPVTDEVRQKVEHRQLLTFISRTNFNQLDLDQLRRVQAVITETDMSDE